MPIGLYGGEEKGDNSQDVESDIEIDRIQIIQEQSRAVAKTARANIGEVLRHIFMYNFNIDQ